MTAVLEPELAALHEIPTGLLSDILLEMGFDRVVVSSNLVNFSGARFVGRAVCAAGGALLGAGAPPPAASMFDVDQHVGPNSVVVIDSGGHRHGAVIGDLVALAFRRAGAVGFVTDGGVRDAADIGRLGLPCVAGFVTPRSAKGLWSIHTVGEPVTLPAQGDGRVTIAPGDVIAVDGDGAVAIPARVVAGILKNHGPALAAEERIRSVIEAGGDRREAFRMHDRFSHIQKRVDP